MVLLPNEESPRSRAYRRRPPRRIGLLGLALVVGAFLAIAVAVLADVPPTPWIGIPLLLAAACGLVLLVLAAIRAITSKRSLAT